jgi:hypothetical protein
LKAIVKIEEQKAKEEKRRKAYSSRRFYLLGSWWTVSIFTGGLNFFFFVIRFFRRGPSAPMGLLTAIFFGRCRKGARSAAGAERVALSFLWAFDWRRWKLLSFGEERAVCIPAT